MESKRKTVSFLLLLSMFLSGVSIEARKSNVRQKSRTSAHTSRFNQLPEKEKNMAKEETRFARQIIKEGVQEIVKKWQREDFGFHTIDDKKIADALEGRALLVFLCNEAVTVKSATLLSQDSGANPGIRAKDDSNAEKKNEQKKKALEINKKKVENSRKKFDKDFIYAENNKLFTAQAKKLLSQIDPEQFSSIVDEEDFVGESYRKKNKKDKGLDATKFFAHYVMSKEFSSQLYALNPEGEAQKNSEVVKKVYDLVITVVSNNDTIRHDVFFDFHHGRFEEKLSLCALKQKNKNKDEQTKAIQVQIDAAKNQFDAYFDLAKVGRVSFKTVSDEYVAEANWKEYGKKGLVVVGSLVAIYGALKGLEYLGEKQGSDALGAPMRAVRSAGRKIKEWAQEAGARGRDLFKSKEERRERRADRKIKRESARNAAALKEQKASSLRAKRKAEKTAAARHEKSAAPSYPLSPLEQYSMNASRNEISPEERHEIALHKQILSGKDSDFDEE